MTSVVKDLISKFSGTSNTEDSSSNIENTSSKDNEAPVTEEPTTHTESKASEPQAPVSADSAPSGSTSSDRQEPAEDNDTKDKAGAEEASKDGAPANLIPNSEHYQASSNVQRILDEAEKAADAHEAEEGHGDAAGEAKNEEPAPQKADKAEGQPKDDKTAPPVSSNSDEPAETVNESGYKPSKNVEHTLDEAEKSAEEHQSEDHAAVDQDEEAKKMDNPTAGATNASHPDSKQPGTEDAEKSKTEEQLDAPGQTTTQSGYTPSEHVKKILADAEEADNANKSEDHAVDTEHHKGLDEPTANMSIHEKSRQDD